MARTRDFYYGDNLPVLRDYIATRSVDLIYLDPPFNSKKEYNVLFDEPGGVKPAPKLRRSRTSGDGMMRREAPTTKSSRKHRPTSHP
ncbi:MAG TPA: hypothetical protein VEZ14_03245 [Dehalococcoidia bacterium]|nr:hypothetical protein [Dehalococcoidia bacterium]